MRKRSERTTPIILLLVGALALALSIYLFIGKQEFLARSVLTDGVVSHLESSSSSKSGKTYFPVVVYKDTDGQEQSFTSQFGSNPASYDEGESVKVRYEPGRPSTAIIVGFGEMWGVIAITGGLGILFTALGIGSFYSALNKAKLRRELPRTGRMLELPGRVETYITKSKTEFFIRTEWHNTADGKMYLFDSEKVFYNPEPFLTNRLVQVWVDPQNPKKRYFMDVAFLPVEA